MTRNLHRACVRFLSILAVAIACLLVTAPVFGQDKFVIASRFKVEKGTTDGARVVIYKNGSKVSTKAATAGKMSFELDYQASYIIAYEKEGYVTKKISIDTHVAEDRIPGRLCSIRIFRKYFQTVRRC